MVTFKRLLVLLTVIALFGVIPVARSQEEPAQPVIDSAITAWRMLEAHSWTWDSCCLRMDDSAARYEAALAAGETEAESVEAWCLEQRAEAYAESCEAWQHMRELMALEPVQDTAALVCECVCMFSQKDCERCIEDPTNPEWLTIPGVCHCIVGH